jgi:hypothetical protein
MGPASVIIQQAYFIYLNSSFIFYNLISVFEIIKSRESHVVILYKQSFFGLF